MVLIDDNEVKGFAAGSLNNKGFFKKLLLNNVVGLGWIFLGLVFKNPKALIRIFVNSQKYEKYTMQYSELLSIATVKNKKGYGKILLSEFEKEVAKQSNLPISLTTDYLDNDKIIDFYKVCGYQVYEIFDSYKKRKMIRFIKYKF